MFINSAVCIELSRWVSVRTKMSVLMGDIAGDSSVPLFLIDMQLSQEIVRGIFLFVL